MSYSIIFETKFLKLSDGRFIHFSREGCNNDNSGRKKNDFTAQILTVDEFRDKFNRFYYRTEAYKALKVGNRWVTYKEYAEHLLRMFNRAKDFDNFISAYHLRAERLLEIQVISPIEKVMTPDEFDNKYYELREMGTLQFFRNMDFPAINSEKVLLGLIESSNPVSFEIRKKVRRDKYEL